MLCRSAGSHGGEEQVTAPSQPRCCDQRRCKARVRAELSPHLAGFTDHHSGKDNPWTGLDGIPFVGTTARAQKPERQDQLSVTSLAKLKGNNTCKSGNRRKASLVLWKPSCQHGKIPPGINPGHWGCSLFPALQSKGAFAAEIRGDTRP